MSLGTEMRSEPAEKQRGLFPLAVLSLLAGMVSGLLGAVFRLLLDQADRWRDTLIAWAHGEKLVGFLLVVAACAGATAVAAWLVRRFSPQAEGSGIPNVEVVARGELPTPPYRLVPVKFLGGLLAIGSGLALGREGPSVQMGASTAHLLGKLFRRNEDDCKTLLAAGAGAGLATAFNAPIAGAVFVLEELLRRFDTRITIATLGASAGAIAVARVLLGDRPDFHVEPLPYPDFGTVPIHLALGLVAGLLGSRLQPCAPRYTCSRQSAFIDGQWNSVQRSSATAVGMTGVVRSRSGRRRRHDHAAHPRRHRDRCHIVDDFSVSVRTRSGSRTRRGRPADCSRPCWYWDLRAVFSSACSGTNGSPPSRCRIQQHWPLSAWPRFSPRWYGRRSPASYLVTELTGSLTLLLPMLRMLLRGRWLVPTLLRNPPIYDSLRERTLKRSV